MRSGGRALSRSKNGNAQQPGQPEVLRQHDAEIEQRAERRNHHPAAAELDAARRCDRQHVKRGEIAGDAAGGGDEPRDDQRVACELNVDDPPVPLGPFERQRPEDVQCVGDADEEKQRLAGNVPGEVSWTKTAEPSSSELMPTRIAISQKSLRRRSRSATAAP